MVGTNRAAVFSLFFDVTCWVAICQNMSTSGNFACLLLRDRMMALNWGAHRPRHLFVARLMKGILRFYPEAQIRSWILRAIFRPLKGLVLCVDLFIVC